jgi:long-chain fatty acid transport protein
MTKARKSGVRLPAPAVAGALVTLALGASAPSHGAGFAIFEQGTKSMGMASAFAGQANDPSTLFFSPGSLSFFTAPEFLLGSTGIRLDGSFCTPDEHEDCSGERKATSEIPPHLFWIRPLTPRWSLGLAEYTPFGLLSEWRKSNFFSGREVNTKFDLKTVDLAVNVGYRAGPRVGLSLGVIGRLTTLEHEREITSGGAPGRLLVESDPELGLGWNAGAFVRVSDRLSLGLTYRSAVDVDYGGSARIERSVLDTESLPLETRIRFPALALVGVAIEMRPRLVVDVDAAWTEWSHFGGLTLAVEGAPELTLRAMDGFQDAWGFRAGVQYTTLGGLQFRAGAVVDSTPQPRIDLSPILADGDRRGLTFGIGYRRVDLSLMYISLDDQETRGNRFGLDGTYATDAWLFGVTLGHR